MKLLNKAGFTIVETMLFLSISALLIMGILVGTGSSINVQRYRDSVTSLQSFLQQQYSDVANVSNDRDDSLACGATDPAPPRGQSDCVILGRFISSINSNRISAKSVIGTIPNTSTATDDVSALQAYNIKVSPVGDSTYDIEWDSSINNSDGSGMAFSMLILRSPLSNVTRTFISDNTATAVSPDDIATLLTEANLSNSTKMCINSNGMLTGTKMAVFVGANTTGASGIETQGDDNGCQ